MQGAVGVSKKQGDAVSRNGGRDSGRDAGLLGKPEHVAVERGIAEFRSGRPVVITRSGVAALALPVDGMTDARLAAFRHLCAPVEPHLVITERRAQALGLLGTHATGLGVARDDAAAIELAKLAQRMPALLVADAAKTEPCDPPLVSVAADAITRFRRSAIESLAVAAEAEVPLNGGVPARFVIFRDAIGGSSVAVIVGTPDLHEPVPLRLHSACLTGDVFGSRRCDCGDQLRLALRRLEEQGGGVILYLEQEGRGLGLANKMRAYQLQDAGLDTIDANSALGFDDDERDYGVAVRMLQILGVKRVKLLTNNPAKLDGLTQAGIEVSGRIPLHGPVNADNRRYLTAKATRAGHKLDHLLAALAEPADAGDAPLSGERTP
jgi:GTP cyclohydrolase II